MNVHEFRGEDADAFREAYRRDPDAILRIDDAERVADVIEEFYRGRLDATGLDGYVVGLSGGVDSAATAALLARALDPERVHALVMPADHTPRETVDDALDLADDLGISTNDPSEFRARVGDAVDVLVDLGEESGEQRLKRGNILARCRMTVLRDVAKARGALVAGTTNASERDLGYMTLAADGKGGVDDEALYDLYKTTVRDLASHLGVPDRTVERAPTADLWEGQTDRDELEFPYDVLDRVLAGLRIGLSPRQVADVVDPGRDAVQDIADRKKRTRYKREPTPYPSFS